MKAKLFALAVGAAASFSAAAGPVVSLPAGPLYLKFNGVEQIAVGAGQSTWGTNASLGSSTAAQAADIASNADHAGEINWGVFSMSTIRKGSITTPHQQIGQGVGTVFAEGLTNNGQITGMIYGVKTAPGASLSSFPATSGYIDLYWRNNDVYSETDSSAVASNIRTSYSSATGYTEGDFLVRLKFNSGIDPTNGNVYISGDTIPTNGVFHGTAASYADVDTSATGLWTQKFDSNWFNTLFGARDFRFNNNYDNYANWNGAISMTPGGPAGIFGAILDDPGSGVALPEPGVLSLMGLAMLGMAVARRRKSS